MKKRCVCGRWFHATRKNSRDCGNHECKAEFNRQYHRKRREKKPRPNALVSVICKCPHCGVLHGVKMAPVRDGFTPRISCGGKNCLYLRENFG